MKNIVSIGAELFSGDDGYCVTAITSEGAIYAHERILSGAKLEAFMAQVEAHVAAGGELNQDHWNFYRNQYGSPAWSLRDEADLLDEEEARHRYWA